MIVLPFNSRISWRGLLAVGATAWLLFAATAGRSQEMLPLVPATGEPQPARLLSWNAEEAVFETAGPGDETDEQEALETFTLPSDDIISWGRLPRHEAGPLLLLADGSLLVAEPLSLRDEMLRVYAASWDEISVPLGQVRGIVYQVPHTTLELDRLLQAIRLAEGERDVITLTSGDQVRGVILGYDAEGYALETDAGRVLIETDNVRQVILAPALVEVPPAPERAVAVGFRDGSYLFAAAVELDEGRLQLELPGLGTLTTPRGLKANDELRLIQPLNAGAVYLSDLDPHSYRHLPFLEMEFPLGLDRNCLGGTLRTEDTAFLKGLGMHSASRAAFNLAGDYNRFQAELALDASTGPRGSVVYRVLAGTPDNWEELYESPVVRGGDPPLAIELEVSGREQLLLVVEYADEADQLDRANWLNARLLP